MIISGKKIQEHLGKNIIIEPFDKFQLNPNSYNLRLSDELLIYDNEVLDMKSPTKTIDIIIPPNGFLLQPGQLYLGRTMEYTETHNLVPGLEGRSSVGRLGINIHATAGFGDVGFCGYWTLEISCVRPVIIYPEVEICQIYYHEITGDFDTYKSNKYQNNFGIQPSMLYKDFE